MNDQERRRYSRIPFDATVVLEGPAGALKTRILDICLKGVLLEVTDDWQGDAQAQYQLSMILSPGAEVHMELMLSHAGGGAAGFICQKIDLDSLSHLRRLAELNLGDSELLNRELQELLAPDAV